MILEHLISKYLDSELTSDEDVELRTVVRSDPNAKDAFDSAVMLHIALSCEDDTQPPADLRLNVFDAIEALAYTAGDHRSTSHRSAIRGPASSLLFSVKQVRKVAALACVLLLLLWSPIHESPFIAWQAITEANVTYTDHSPTGQHLEYTSLRNHVVKGVRRAAALTQPINTLASTIGVESATLTPESTRQSSSDQFAANVERAETPYVDGSTVSIDKHSTDNTIHQPTLASAFASTFTSDHRYDQYTTSVVPTESVQQEEQRSPTPTEPPSSTGTPVTFSTAYAAGMGSSVAQTSNIRQYTASIGFEVEANSLVGLEVGSMEYDMRLTSVGAVPINGSRSTMIVHNARSGKLAVPDVPPLRYSTDSITSVVQERQVWGSAFYERSVISSHHLAIRGRVGTGVSEDGLIAYGRVLGTYDIGRYLSVVAGAEVRGMNFRTGSVSGSSSASAFGAVVTALTGLYVRF
ncbi:MAG: hypothetical protein J5I53_01375 [Bradyrhizobiaceae bacterium]|nr:hypothetical protein [Bradyrhizobiaceae bacterium]